MNRFSPYEIDIIPVFLIGNTFKGGMIDFLIAKRLKMGICFCQVKCGIHIQNMIIIFSISMYMDPPWFLYVTHLIKWFEYKLEK